MVKETPDTRSQCRITACLLHRKQKKKENSALYYYEVYGVMPSGFSCTSRESGRDKGVPACGAQHETDENTVLQRKLSSFLSVTVSGASQLLELRGGHDGHDSLGRARHAGERKEGKKGKGGRRRIATKTEETKKMEMDLDGWCFLVGPGFFGVFGGLIILVNLVWRFRREFGYLGAFFVAAS